MNRRHFIQNSAIYSGAVFLGCKKAHKEKTIPFPHGCKVKSKVIISKDDKARDSDGKLISKNVLAMLDRAIMNLQETGDIQTAWRQLISKDDRVSIKLNCLAGKGISTNKELVDAVIYRLKEIGLKNENILVWERLNDDLERAGYQIVTDRDKIRYIGNDLAGYYDQFFFYGEIGSLLSRVVTDFSTVIINLPVLKDHGIVGASIGMKNMFGAIHNPNKYHINVGDPFVADVNALPIIKDRLKLVICDALTMQYDGGPPYKPQCAVEYNSLMVATDPVALDYVGWKIIEEKRKANGFPSLKEAGREPKYILTAADETHQIGYASDEQINVINID